ncbi:MAG: hypothetical protein ABIZ64_07200 [Casimicrobium sp.]
MSQQRSVGDHLLGSPHDDLQVAWLDTRVNASAAITRWSEVPAADWPEPH